MGKGKQGFIVGYESEGNGNFVLDGLVDTRNGKYKYLEAEGYQNDGSIKLVFVNIYKHIKAGIDSGEGLAITLQDGMMVSEADITTRGTYTTFKSPAMREGCLMRIHYLTDEEKDHHLFVRIRITRSKATGSEDEEDYTLTVDKLQWIKDFTNFGGKEEVQKIFAETHMDMIEEVAMLELVLGN